MMYITNRPSNSSKMKALMQMKPYQNYTLNQFSMRVRGFLLDDTGI